MVESNNMAYASGRVASKPVLSHAVYGENYYTFGLAVKRLSGIEDMVPVMVSERLIDIAAIQEGVGMNIEGQFRSRNMDMANGHRRCMLHLFAKEATFRDDAEEDKNDITLHGFLCKEPTYRETPLGREITDALVAVNRSYGKSDYIPCICWGRNARYLSSMGIGTKVLARGRIQSRRYTKYIEGVGPEERIAYEVSVTMVEQE